MPLPQFTDIAHKASWPAAPPLFGEARFGELGQVSYPLYRYTRLDWFNAAKFSGNWWLGTLFGYRDLADFHRQDRGEGSRWDSKRISARLGANGLIGGDARNMWTMCCAQQRSERFFNWPDNNCCFSINNERFFVEIARGLSNRAKSSVIAQVGYAGWEEFIDIAERDELVPNRFEVDMARWKLPGDEWQAEVRLMIEPWCPMLPPGPDTFNWAAPDLNMMQAGFLPKLQPTFSFAPDAAQYVSLIEER